VRQRCFTGNDDNRARQKRHADEIFTGEFSYRTKRLRGESEK
jgi:hypothetical protein